MTHTRSIAIVMALTTATAAAQQPPDRLDSVNGVPFGATLEQARAILGPAAKVKDGLRGRRAREVKLLDIEKVTLFGVPFHLSYAFVAGERMTSAVATAEPVGDDVAACQTIGNLMLDNMTRAIGRPSRDVLTEQSKGLGSFRQVRFDYRDGSSIVTRYGLDDLFGRHCSVDIHYTSPQGRDDFTLNPF